MTERIPWLVLTVALISACGGQPVAPEPEPEIELPDEGPAFDPYLLQAGPELGSAWLVILASKTTPAPDPPGMVELIDDPTFVAGARPGRLDSSHFKGLEPCHEVVFAYAGQDMARALTLGGQLTPAGVPNVVKNAGAWVGDRPAVSAYCERVRAGKQAGCPDGLRFAERWGDHVYVDLGLSEDEAKGALASASPAVSLGGEHAAWAAPLGVQSAGGMSIGDSVSVAAAAGGEPQSCPVSRFVGLTRGVPHWRWGEGWRDQPGCGQPEVFAELECDQPGAVLATTGAMPLRAAPGGEATTASAQVRALLEASPVWTIATTEAQRLGEGRPVIEEVTMRPWTWKGRALVEVSGRLTTGEGRDECGGEELNIRVGGLFAGGDAVVPLRIATHEEWIGFLDTDGDGQLEVLSHAFPGMTTIHVPLGEPRCSIEVPYCANPC